MNWTYDWRGLGVNIVVLAFALFSGSLLYGAWEAGQRHHEKRQRAWAACEDVPGRDFDGCVKREMYR